MKTNLNTLATSTVSTSIRRPIRIGILTFLALESLVACLIFTPIGHKVLPLPTNASRSTSISNALGRMGVNLAHPGRS